MTAGDRPPPIDPHRLRAEVALVVVTAIWGSTFVVVKEALSACPPFAFLAARFLLATIPFLPLLARPAARSPRLWRQGTLLGLLVFVGFAFQTVGLQTTTPSRSAFLTALSSVLVPLLGAPLLRRAPRPGTWIALVAALAGLVLLTRPTLERPLATGDALTLGCAVAFALQILFLGEFVRETAPLPLVAAQIAVCAGLGVPAFLLSGESLPPPTLPLAGALVGTGLLATALAFLVQNYAQRHTSATRAAFVFALEPAFASLFAALFGGERFGPADLAGGALVVASVLVAETSGVPAFRARRARRPSAPVSDRSG